MQLFCENCSHLQIGVSNHLNLIAFLGSAGLTLTPAIKQYIFCRCRASVSDQTYCTNCTWVLGITVADRPETCHSSIFTISFALISLIAHTYLCLSKSINHTHTHAHTHTLTHTHTHAHTHMLTHTLTHTHRHTHAHTHTHPHIHTHTHTLSCVP